MKTIELRQHFLNYFRKNGFKFMPQSKVYNDDPTLFFVNSGMCQLKDVFLGQRVADEKYSNLMNSQICIRAGGKHNDLDDVGKDSYHLTSFEMAGNWLLNNPTRSEAIDLAYNFLVNECGLNKDQMYVTYFEGNENIPADNGSKEAWLKHFPEDRVIASSFKDNFWMMGEYGPCGPCTEIHYDLNGNRNATNLVNKDDPTVIEIWNLVFMQYNRTEQGYNVLDKVFCDTGMGLERLAMVVQNKSSLYQTDAFKYLFGYVQALTGAEFYTDSYGPNFLNDTALRIFVDHIRTCVIALHQGVEFDAHKRGHILKKIFRRMIINVYVHLNKQVEPLMKRKLINALISQILDYFLEFKHDADKVQEKLMEEEQLVINMISNSRKMYEKDLKKYKGDKVKAMERLKVNMVNYPEIVDNIESLKVVLLPRQS
jgi:alanyl-tRNA synthetase